MEFWNGTDRMGKTCTKRGAGEILLTSIEQGTWEGFDQHLFPGR